MRKKGQDEEGGSEGKCKYVPIHISYFLSCVNVSVYAVCFVYLCVGVCFEVCLNVCVANENKCASFSPKNEVNL